MVVSHGSPRSCRHFVMGAAAVADVRGEHSCSIVIKFVECFLVGPLGTRATFEALIPSCCACSPLGDGHRVELFIDGTNPRSSTMDADANVPGTYTGHVLAVEEVDHTTARCVTGTGDSLQVHAMSNPITWTMWLDVTCTFA